MSKFEQKKFSVGGHSKAYGANYDAVFKKKAGKKKAKKK